MHLNDFSVSPRTTKYSMISLYFLFTNNTRMTAQSTQASNDRMISD
jgi:hypothetical protein